MQPTPEQNNTMQQLMGQTNRTQAPQMSEGGYSIPQRKEPSDQPPYIPIPKD
jgi:hypothetical protein